jgi:sortase A
MRAGEGKLRDDASDQTHHRHGDPLFGLAALIGFKPKKATSGYAKAEADKETSSAGGELISEGGPSGGEKPKPRRWNHRLGKVFIVIGLALLAYSAAVLLWRDPVTDLYARWKQHQLAGELDDQFAAYAATVKLTPPPAEAVTATPQEISDYEHRAVEAAANKLSAKLKNGKPLGRISIPRIHVHAIFVQGTRWGPDLSQGPGHYPQTSLPGVGRTVALAAHRTTFGAWFRHIDSLQAGDQIVLRLPYATFHYRVFGHKVVDNGNWHIIRDRGFDALVLSACHPLYSASHRWIVFAALFRVDPVHGKPYLVNRRNEVRPVSA